MQLVCEMQLATEQGFSVLILPPGSLRDQYQLQQRQGCLHQGASQGRLGRGHSRQEPLNQNHCSIMLLPEWMSVIYWLLSQSLLIYYFAFHRFSYRWWTVIWKSSMENSRNEQLISFKVQVISVPRRNFTSSFSFLSRAQIISLCSESMWYTLPTH